MGGIHALIVKCRLRVLKIKFLKSIPLKRSFQECFSTTSPFERKVGVCPIGHGTAFPGGSSGAPASYRGAPTNADISKSAQL